MSTGTERTLPSTSRLDGIRQLLTQPESQTAPNNQARGWRTDCEYLDCRLDEALRLLKEAAPHLRTLASQCEACEGSGEIVLGPSDEEAYSEPCKHCAPLWDLAKRADPPAPPAPIPVEELDDDIAF